MPCCGFPTPSLLSHTPPFQSELLALALTSSGSAVPWKDPAGTHMCRQTLGVVGTLVPLGPGPGQGVRGPFLWDPGRQDLSGVLTLRPQPLEPGLACDEHLLH